VRRPALLCLPMLLLAACGGGSDDLAAATSAPVSSAAPSADDREQAAYDACVEAATDRLKAPATAEFADREDVDVTVSGSTYTVVGDVDSENGFGALIRNTYTCEVFIASSGRPGSATVTFADR